MVDRSINRVNKSFKTATFISGLVMGSKYLLTVLDLVYNFLTG